jgi:rhamnose transport system permease protein
MAALPASPSASSPTPRPPAGKPASPLHALLRHESVLAVLLVIALAVLATQSDRFFTADNLLNQGRLMTEVSLIALAMTFVIITGGIDLSVGSIFGLAAILLGVFWQKLGMPLPLAMCAAVVVGTVAGLVNGLIITRFGVPPLIATLATLMLYRGFAEGISQGRSVRGYPEWFLDLAQSESLGVPNQLWLLVACALVAGVILGYTTWGRATYAIGANETAARFSGIATEKTKLLSALAAVIFVSRVSTTRSDMGSGMELDVITAVVLGGTSIFGGRGTIVGTVLGLMVMQALKNGLSLAGVKGDGTIIVIGLILIGAIFISNIFNRDGEG